MANALVQQRTNSSPSISINRPAASKKDTSLVMSNSVDDRILFNHSNELINFLQRFASEPQISKRSSPLIHTNGSLSITKPLKNFTLSVSTSNSCIQVNQTAKDEINHLICDKVEPVSISSTTTNSIPKGSANGTDEATEDILLDTSSATHDGNSSHESYSRRRRRRSSLTKTSISLDEAQLKTDVLEKPDHNSTEVQQPNENVVSLENNDLESTNAVETKPPEVQESNQITSITENSDSTDRPLRRRLRNRPFRNVAAASSSSPQTITSSDLHSTYEELNVEMTSTPPPTPLITSSISSPALFTSNTCSIRSGREALVSKLKRASSAGSTKKSVRFADTVGRQLTQVLYIQSSNEDPSDSLSCLLGSSNPTYLKNNLYVSSSSYAEPKPWSFGVILSPYRPLNEKTLLKRYFCLYRQPSSEHPDIYLHEIWKSQIKLEFADIPMKCSLTGEQKLNGTLWVTNIAFEKHVFVKYTFNLWSNTYEYEAQHCYHSNDHRNIDQFQFSISIPKDVDRIDFVLRYSVNGNEYWDNNNGRNYTIQTESNSATSTISLPHDCDFNEMRFY